MAKNKTVETQKSVSSFIKGIKNEQQRKDCAALVTLLSGHTGFDAKMWGPAIVGFGNYHYKYESGREGDMPLASFSPRASSIVFYVSSDFEKRDDLLESLGKHKLDGGCLHIKKLEDIDVAVLKKIITSSVKHRKSHSS